MTNQTTGGMARMAADHVGIACASFQRFVTTWTVPETEDKEAVYLEDLLACWLYVGAGIEDTAANYDHFLQVVLHIIDGVLKGSVSLDYEGEESEPFARRMVGLTDPALGSNVMSRMGFDQVVHQTLEGRRSEELTARLPGLMPAGVGGPG